MRITTEHWLSLNETESTNTLLLDGDYPSGSMVTARHQSGGRGRRGRSWGDVTGGSFLFSLLLEFDSLPANPGMLPLLAGLCVLEAAESALASLHPGLAAQSRFSLKWPNDVLITRNDVTGKLAGVLLESRLTGQRMRLVTGVGLNWSSSPASDGAVFSPVSLFGDREGGHPGTDGSPELFLPWLVDAFNARYYGSGGPPGGLSGGSSLYEDLWKRFYLAGARIRTGVGEGRVAGIDRDGALLIDGRDHRFRFDRTDEEVQIL